MKNILILLSFILFSLSSFSQDDVERSDDFYYEQIRRIDSLIEIESTDDNFYLKGQFLYKVKQYKEALN